MAPHEPLPPPPPARVPGNRWTDLEAPEPGSWSPNRSVSVVIPHYEAERSLATTLAALAHQTYPAELFEVVVADDGSTRPPDVPDQLPMYVRVVTQERRGFGLARARNTGAAAAEGEILAFLDCDMVPEPEWLEAHARWHHLVDDAVTLGFRRHVDFDGIDPDDIATAAARGSLAPLFSNRRQERPEWIEWHMERTAALTSNDPDLFRVVTGGNLALRADTFERAGRYDETFIQWGAEDIELGYRLFTDGALLVPERRAACWHQGLGNVPDPDEQRSLEEQRAKISHLVAERSFRRRLPGRSYHVPSLVVRVDSEAASGAGVLESVEAVLAGRFDDLVVVLRVPPTHPEATWISRQLGDDPRVVVASDRADTPDRLRFAAATVELPPTLRLGPKALARVVDRLDRGAGTLTCRGPRRAGRATLRAVTTRARRRAQRTATRPDDVELEAPRLFGEHTLHHRLLGMTAVHDTAVARARVGLTSTSPMATLWRRLRSVRSPRDALRALRWLTRSTRQRLGRRAALSTRRGGSPTRRPPPPAQHRPSPAERLNLWVAFTATPAAEWVGQAVRVVDDDAADDSSADQLEHLDVLVAGGSSQARTVQRAAQRGARIVVVGSTDPTDGITPDARVAFEPAPTGAAASTREVDVRSPIPADPATANPIGAPAVVDPRAIEATVTNPATSGLHLPGALPDRRCRPALEQARSHRAVTLPPEHYPDATARGAWLTSLTAAGAVPVLDTGDPLRSILSPRLDALVPQRVDDVPHEVDARELLSVRLRREALRGHSTAAWWRRVADVVTLALPPPPCVSILLTTNRPEQLDHALRQIANQAYPRTELVAVLHGDAFDDGARRRIKRQAGCPATVVRVAPDRPFGEAADLGSQVASGDVVTKFDDDDWYDAEHLWDVVLALQYSGAELVGKAAELVYLADEGVTLRRFVGGGESFGSRTFAGGTLALRRETLRSLGGWRHVRRRLDQALIEDVLAAGGTTYRTHGFGYVLHRHGHGHTWEPGPRYFLDQAETRRHGLDLAFAGVAGHDTDHRGPDEDRQ